MQRKLCLVTGADSGIGKGLATSLAEAGHHVIACSRTGALGKQAQRDLIAQTGSRYVDFVVADLASLASVKHAAEEVIERYGSLDVLCNIAGANFFTREVTENHIEAGLQVNVLAPFYLTQLLLPALKTAGHARIVNVVGEYHRKATLDLDDLQWETRPYSVMKSGNMAMLMRVLLTFEWARRLKSEGITANCFHPGAVRTSLLKSFPWYYRLFLGWMQLFFKSPRKGADTGLYLALSEEVKAISGQYWINREIAAPSAESKEEELAQKLWAAMENLLRGATF